MLFYAARDTLLNLYLARCKNRLLIAAIEDAISSIYEEKNLRAEWILFPNTLFIT